ncbi:MAG TPA: ketose-bisphosphate aldolase, partial [Clostridiales bacterium]|nr:ketose-bisphosphate aldolase [Clostridiales bacterium]
MYLSMATLLNDAARHNYAIIAANALNLEMARGLISAAVHKESPLIIILGGNQMARHANGELMAGLIRTLAESAPVPVALCLDHGKDFAKVAYCLRHGFNSIMVDASAYDIADNIARTQKVVELCRPLGIGVEGELGHVGMAAALDGRN